MGIAGRMQWALAVGSSSQACHSGHLNLKSTIKTGLSYLFDLLTVVFSLLLAVSCNIDLFVLSSF